MLSNTVSRPPPLGSGQHNSKTHVAPKPPAKPPPVYNSRLPPPRIPPVSVPVPKIGPNSTDFALRKYIDSAEYSFRDVGWEETVYALRTPPDLHPCVQNIPHPAARYLDYLRKHGCPIKTSTPPWSAARLDAAIARGPHKSANDYQDFLVDEMATMCDKGQWMVLPYDSVKHLPHLHISPLGVVPQHERRPRTIVDYTFSDMNGELIPLAPHEAMQFGRALERFLW